MIIVFIIQQKNKKTLLSQIVGKQRGGDNLSPLGCLSPILDSTATFKHDMEAQSASLPCSVQLFSNYRGLRGSACQLPRHRPTVVWVCQLFLIIELLFKKLPGYFIRPHPGYMSSSFQPPDPDKFYDIGFTMKLFDLCVDVLPHSPLVHTALKIFLRIDLSKQRRACSLGLWNSPAFKVVYKHWPH